MENKKRALATLKKYYGYDKFRPLQLEIIEDVLNKKDCVVILPSGGGKSITFQIPALLSHGIAIVISPLIALMKDQVNSLLANGIKSEYLNSSLSVEEQNNILSNLNGGGIKLLYVSPEKLLSNGFIDILKTHDISFFAIDEAHCISAWGHDFRPEYSQLSALKREFPSTPIMALTATADKVTRRDIAKQLRLADYNEFLGSFDRPNLSLNVAAAQNRFKTIVEFISVRPSTSGIIYCLSRKSTESMSSKLNEIGIKSSYYHAGMSADARNQAQDDFINDKIPVICATIAFGMGIDKSNVRWVIHYNLPKNIEGYYQEIGRAGRDGLESDTLLFYNFGDVIQLKSFAENSGQKEIQLAKLQRMQQYAEAPSCRRKILLSYFNELREDNCNNCDVCHDPPRSFEGTIISQMALSAILRLKENVPSGLLIDVLRGSERREILEAGYNNIKTFGKGHEISYFDWQQYLMQMLNQGLIEIAYDENNNLRVTELGKKVLFDFKKVELVKVQSAEKYGAKKEKKQKKLTKKEKLKLEMASIIRDLRQEISGEESVAPHIVFSDKTVDELAENRPVTLKELSMISGLGEFKLEKYSDKLLNKIVEFKIENKDRKSTQLMSLKLLNQNLSIDDVAKERKLSTASIYTHIGLLYAAGHSIDMFKYISKDDLELIKPHVEKFGADTDVRKYFELMKGKLDFGKIRLALAYFNSIED